MTQEKTIYLDFEAEDQADLFKKVADMFLSENKVKASYLDALIAREGKYPTGLEADTNTIAIPHVDSDHVLVNEVVFIRTQKPIVVHEMMTSKEIDVELFFFLLVKDKGNQVQTLQKIMGLVAQEGIIEALKNAQTEEDVRAILSQ